MLLVVAFLLADSFQVDFQAGLAALNQSNLPAAQSNLEAASKLQPANPRVWLALAETYRRLHQADAADRAALRVEKLTNDPAVLHTLSVYYSEAGNFARAEDLMRAAIAQNRFDESYYFELADLCLKHQQFAAALETLDAGRKLFDKSPQLELASGVAYYGLRRFAEAIDAFLRTIELDPGVPQPYLFLGRIWEQAEDQQPRIRAVFAAFAQTAPGNYLSGYLYAKSLALENPGQAEALLRRSIALNDRFPDSHFDLGVLLERQQRFAEAAREIERAIVLNPRDPAPHYRLSRLYERLGNTAAAAAERALHEKLSAGGTR
ncbi:MAG: tetratricopeptide repeat protein [Bryobacteraceae bacterium]